MIYGKKLINWKDDMDRLPKAENTSIEGLEAAEKVKKEVLSGTTKTSREVKTTTEGKKIPISKGIDAKKKISERAGEVLTSTEAVLQEIEALDLLVASARESAGIEKSLIEEQKDFDETIILADLDPFLGFGRYEDELLVMKNEYDRDKDTYVEKTVQVEPRTKLNNLGSYMASITKNKSLENVALENLSSCLAKQMKHKNISLDNVIEEDFQKELNVLLQDMHSRGISITSKIRKMASLNAKAQEKLKDKFYASPSSFSERIEGNKLWQLTRYNELFSQIHEFDVKLKKFLNSGSCSKWDSSLPLYRGGDASLERKMLRNIEKDKTPFRNDIINRSQVKFGYGQYYTNMPSSASVYANGKVSPVILTVFLKPETLLINHIELQDFFGEDDKQYSNDQLTWKEYIRIFCKEPVIISTNVFHENKPMMFTLPHGQVVDQVTMSAKGDLLGSPGPKAVAELSMHRLAEDGRIVGHPEKFETVNILDKEKLVATDFKALGAISGEPLPVSKCQINAQTVFVVSSTEKEGEYWLVKQMPESLTDEKPTFILEPSDDFLLQRKKEKSHWLQSPEGLLSLEGKATENSEIIRGYFNTFCELHKSL